MPLTLATFNIRYPTPLDGEDAWPHRRDLVVATIRSLEADALGLQEVTAGQRAELEAALPEFAFFGRGRNAGGDGEQVAILVRRERVAASEGGHFWLSPTPSEPGSRGWDAHLPRMCTWVRLEGGPWLFNVHLDHAGPKSRLESARLLLDRLPEGQPAVLLGDFNAEPGEEPIRVLETRLVDTWRAVHPHTPAPATWQGFDRAAPGMRIDYLWVTPDLGVESCQVVRRRLDGRCPSDHDPVVARLRP